ncbi:MAG: TOBE domain-containing protein [Leptolyngbyaceae cyanobacterium RU_5_1]|nr:TOBE domain-containing protein [Leptolyngbyaceae cyanobacterium RU_5_1]
MPRKHQGWITFQSSEEERQILEQYCRRSQRTKTEILRELVRTLDRDAIASTAIQEPTKGIEKTTPDQSSGLKSMKVSARNLLKGTITQLIVGSVNAEVILEIAQGVKLVSTITRASADRLKLTVGKEVYAVIKSSSIMIAEETNDG